MFTMSFIQLVSIMLSYVFQDRDDYRKERLLEMDGVIQDVNLDLQDVVDNRKERFDMNGITTNKYLGFRFDELPVGYKFAPTDSELMYFLENKAVSMGLIPLIPNPIQDIEATRFYSKPPNKLEWDAPAESKDMYFFIHHTEDSYRHFPTTRNVADGIGCWKPNGDAVNVCKSLHLCYGIVNYSNAYKLSYDYFRGKPPAVGKELSIKLKKTAWVMDEYHLPQDYYYNFPKMEGKWVLGRIKCGRNAYINS